jgi:hypothetical protein
MSHPFMIYVLAALVLSAFVLQAGEVKLASPKDTFAAIEYLALVVVSAISLYNYERLKNRLVFIFGNDGGRAIWVAGNIHIHCMICVIIFLAALWVLHKQYAVLYCFLLTVLYVVFLWSNRSIALSARSLYSGLDRGQAKLKYFALLELMTTGARKENIPALIGYVLLFLVALAFYVWAKIVVNDVSFLPLLNAYIAGAATLHFAISVLSFSNFMRFSDLEEVEPWAAFLQHMQLQDCQIENVAGWHHAEVDAISPTIQRRSWGAICVASLPFLSVVVLYGWPT